MSNVLKSVYFNVDAKQKHIIDSEQRMEELIPQMYTAEESKQDSYTFQPLTAEELASGQAQSGYRSSTWMMYARKNAKNYLMK